MSLASAEAFMDRMKSDEEFAKKVNGCKDAEARLALARSEGYTFTKEEISQVKSELSDEELDQVAGGSGDICCCLGDFWGFKRLFG